MSVKIPLVSRIIDLKSDEVIFTSKQIVSGSVIIHNSIEFPFGEQLKNLPQMSVLVRYDLDAYNGLRCLCLVWTVIIMISVCSH